MEYIKVAQAAEKWGLTPRRVRTLCAEEKIDGVIRRGKLYMIPADAPRPADGRKRRGMAIPKELRGLFLKIDTLKTQLDSRRPLTEGEVERLREEFLVNFTYNSNAIEGNTLTLQETAMVLQGLTIDKKPLKDHLEVVGHRDAFLYVEGIAKDTVLSKFIIKNIHALVLMHRPDDKGVYRRIPVSIMGAHTQPVQPYLIEPKMTELLLENGQRKKTMHPIERIARFHLEFESIHPFIDGNGRTGRLILNLDLIQNGFPPINVKFSDRRRYYNAFEAWSRQGDVQLMAELIGEYVADGLGMYLEVLERTSN